VIGCWKVIKKMYNHSGNIHCLKLADYFYNFSFLQFGFPETIATMYCALFDTKLGVIERGCLFIEATGTMIHHSSGSLVICMLITGTMTPDRSICAPILVLCVQHWFVLLRYFHKNLYILVEVILEVLFEWTVFSNFERYSSNHWTAAVAAAGMLLAHWMWFTSGTVVLVSSNIKEQKNMVYTKERSSSRLFSGRSSITSVYSSANKDIHSKLMRLSLTSLGADDAWQSMRSMDV